MANLSITTTCNQHCSYCFARPLFRIQNSLPQQMSPVTFERALDFLQCSGIDQVRLLGGEPTLHPQFSHFLDRITERNLRILVFSNGLIPETALKHLEQISKEQVDVLLNVPPPDEASPDERSRRSEVLQRLGSRITPGFNIKSPALRYEFLLDLIDIYHLHPIVRLGLAHPSLAGQNEFLPPQYYAHVGQRVIDFVKQARENGVTVDFDCGFVPCMFSVEGLDILGESAQTIGTRCNPILDILPDGQVVSCYPLGSRHQEALPLHHNADWLRQRFEKHFAPYRFIGIFNTCSSCSFQANGSCAGGCLAMALRRIRSQTFSIDAPHQNCASGITLNQNEFPAATQQPASRRNQGSRWVIPYIDQPLSFWTNLAQAYPERIKGVYLPFPDDLLGSGRPPQPARHVQEFLHHPPLPVVFLLNPIVLPQPVEKIAPRLLDRLREFDSEAPLGEIIVANLDLARRLRDAFPDISLTASVLMDITHPNQALMLQDVFDTLIPSTRIMRQIPELHALRDAFNGPLRGLVNEACLPGCPFRVQHFYEMGTLQHQPPRSLCDALLRRDPWLRLTGAWTLPQHLHLFHDVYDEFKLTGRVTLQNPAIYLKVLDAYLNQTPLAPNEIGGGPASMLSPLPISEEFYQQTLYCHHHCHTCTICKDYYQQAMAEISGEQQRR